MISWDIFGDEKKDAGHIAGVGMLVLEKGVVCQLAQGLLDEKNRMQGTKGKIGSIHWSELTEWEVKLACKWLDRFLNAPLTFFVYIPAPDKKMSRLDLVKRTVERLENDPSVPEGLRRDCTTLHLDYEYSDARDLNLKLVREFGLLRAYHWDDRGSVLLQLTDLLLGISEHEFAGKIYRSSKRGQMRKRIIDYARNKTRIISNVSKDTWVLCYEPNGKVRRLLV